MNENIKPDKHFDLDDLPADRDLNKGRAVKVVIIAVVLLIILGLAGGSYYYWQKQKANESVRRVAKPTPEVRATPEPVEATPEPMQPTAAPTPTPVPLPRLNESDTAIKANISEISQDMLGLVANEEIVRKSVRAIYSLYKGNVVQQYRPLNGPNTSIQAQATGETAQVKTQEGEVDTPVFQMTDQDFSRYTSYANLAREISTEQLSAAYKYFYPLLQTAHGELGEGPEQFHTVVIGALDKMLATPDVDDSELKLIRTSIIYQFKDEQLENLPAAQKLLLRMGSDNRETVLHAVRNLRDALAEYSPE